MSYSCVNTDDCVNSEIVFCCVLKRVLFASKQTIENRKFFLLSKHELKAPQTVAADDPNVQLIQKNNVVCRSTYYSCCLSCPCYQKNYKDIHFLLPRYFVIFP